MDNGSDLVGKTLGTCTLEKIIGHGGMSVVYFARQARPFRHVAVKVLLPKVTMGSDVHQRFLARFRREADVIANLDHVNIVPIHEYDEQDGLAYLVMPYFARGSLRDVMVERRTLSPRETTRYLEQAAAALDYAHARGIIHRDLKPSNFLLHTDGRLVLADFGIARMMNDWSATIGATLTGTGIVLGTPEYMAPEMARGEPIDARTDIYELGIVLFQMLSGNVPFKGDTPLAVIFKHLEEAAPSLHQRNPTIPLAVNTVVQKAIAKRPEDRYMSAGSMARAFRDAIKVSQAPSKDNAHNAPSSPPLPLMTPLVLKTPPSDLRAIDATTEQVPIAQIRKIPAPDSPALSVQAAQPATSRKIPDVRLGNMRTSRSIILIILPVIALVIAGIIAFRQVLVTFAGPSNPISTPTVAATPTRAQQARLVIRRYYNDINKKDYRDAYNLWQYTTTPGPNDYQNFVNGYANTVRDDITVDSSTLLSDGTVEVYITINATEKTTTGTVVNVYQARYDVGQVNGTWKILKGSGA